MCALYWKFPQSNILGETRQTSWSYLDISFNFQRQNTDTTELFSRYNDESRKLPESHWKSTYLAHEKNIFQDAEKVTESHIHNAHGNNIEMCWKVT